MIVQLREDLTEDEKEEALKCGLEFSPFYGYEVKTVRYFGEIEAYGFSNGAFYNSEIFKVIEQ